jgi:hypothetical protein
VHRSAQVTRFCVCGPASVLRGGVRKGVRSGRPLASPGACEGDDDGGGGVRRRVRGDALERGARLRLERQAVAVEHAAGLVPGDRHCFVRRDAGVDEVGDGGVPGVVKDVAATLATDWEAVVHAVAQSRLKSPTHP